MVCRGRQSDNGTFTSKVTQGVSKELGITYYLYCVRRPQSLGKVERAHQFLKSAIKKITQETSLGWKKALPIALLHTCIAPKEQVGLSLYEMLYGRPFVYVNDLFYLGNGNPLQCSCLENPRDGGAWWAAIYGVTQSWTRLK